MSSVAERRPATVDSGRHRPTHPTEAGRAIEFDFEELDEGGRGDRDWSRAFRERSPSLATYLVEWLDAPTAPPVPQFAIGPMRYPGTGSGF